MEGTNHISDQEIIDLFKSNADAGIKAIFDKYWDKLYHYSFKIVESEDAAKDIVQNLFVSLWENQAKAENIRSLKHYLYQSVRNNTIQYLKNNQFGVLHEHLLAELKETEQEEKEQVHQEQNDLLKRRIEELPPKRKEIFTLSRYKHLSNEQIATKLNLSIRTVETQISNALRYLRKTTS